MGMSEPHCNLEKQPSQEKPPDFYELLRKGNRLEGNYIGNRNPWMAANMYFSMIARQDRLIEWVVKSALSMGKSESEVEKTRARTERVVGKRRQQSLAFAISRCAGTGLHHNAVRVLSQMLLYGWHTGYCCAAQSTIARTLGLSRQTVHKWVHRLKDDGLIKLVSYDARGGFEWRGRAFIKWCLVFETFFKWGRVDTNPISALAVGGLSVGSSAFSGHYLQLRDAPADFFAQDDRVDGLTPLRLVGMGARYECDIGGIDTYKNHSMGLSVALRCSLLPSVI